MLSSALQRQLATAHISSLFVLLLATTIVAQGNFTSVIAGNPNLANLTQFLGFYPALVQQLEVATNITFLAPNNDAFTKLLSSSSPEAIQTNDTSLVEALFSYHTLIGIHKSTDPHSTPSFIPTTLSFVPKSLDGSTYTTLEGGQVVEAVINTDRTTFVSGLLQASTATETVGDDQVYQKKVG